jgi:hypothetical protein
VHFYNPWSFLASSERSGGTTGSSSSGRCFAGRVIFRRRSRSPSMDFISGASLSSISSAESQRVAESRAASVQPGATNLAYALCGRAYKGIEAEAAPQKINLS